MLLGYNVILQFPTIHTEHQVIECDRFINETFLENKILMIMLNDYYKYNQ